LKGHGFSRAAKATIRTRALAPEGCLLVIQTRNEFDVMFIESEGGVIVMDGTVIAALITGPLSFAGGIVAIVLTQRGSRKRDHEADWRKMKLEHYEEYVAALSGTVHHPSEETVKRRYSDAFNSMALVAPLYVMAAMYALNDETKKNSQDKDLNKYEILLSSMMRAMRKDCHPKNPKDDPEFIFHTIKTTKD
jgi:hypothetical protein